VSAASRLAYMVDADRNYVGGAFISGLNREMRERLTLTRQRPSVAAGWQGGLSQCRQHHAAAAEDCCKR
jgi:hypothetical protein